MLALKSQKTLLAACAVAAALVWGAGAAGAQQAPKRLPLIYVLATGGTIAEKGGNAASNPALSGNQLVEAVPEIAQIAETRIKQVSNIGSSSMSYKEWKVLAEEANKILNSKDEDVAGIVITHGTNTIEETAYFLNLTVKSDKPVVLVGSQRQSSALSADGPANIYNAIRVAAEPAARGKGVLVAMNEEINGARDVFKSNTFRVEAFRSGEMGFLGYIDTDKVSFYRAPLQRHTTTSEFDVSGLDALPPVEIVYSYVDASGLPITAFAKAGVRGVIIAGHGAGGMSPAQDKAITDLRKEGSDFVVIRSSHTGNGRVIEREGNKAKVILYADNLTPKKARILLQLALTKTKDPAEIQRMFLEY